MLRTFPFETFDQILKSDGYINYYDPSSSVQRHIISDMEYLQFGFEDALEEQKEVVFA